VELTVAAVVVVAVGVAVVLTFGIAEVVGRISLAVALDSNESSLEANVFKSASDDAFALPIASPSKVERSSVVLSVFVVGVPTTVLVVVRLLPVEVADGVVPNSTDIVAACGVEVELDTGRLAFSFSPVNIQ